MNTLKFSIESMLSINAENRVSASASPFLFACATVIDLNQKFNRLARVRFEDRKVLQRYEDGALTTSDILVVGNQFSNDLYLSLWVDLGHAGLPVAMEFDSDPGIIITPIYRQYDFERKLTDREIQQLFNYLFDHPEEIVFKSPSNGEPII